MTGKHTRKFTDTWLQSYKPKSSRDEIFETGQDGFGVRVTGTCKSFFLVRRIAGKRVRISLGKYPQTRLSNARAKARAILDDIGSGQDPRDAYRVRKPSVVESSADLFVVVAKRFIREYCEGKKSPLRARTIEGYKWALEGTLTEKWAKMPVAQISDKDVIRIVDGLEADKHHASARLFRAYVRKFFNWAMGKRLLRENPAANVPLNSSVKELERDRTLSLHELKSVLRAADKLPAVFRDFIWTLVLTGQRRGEVAQMKWSELMLEGDKPLWTIPAENSKNRRAHDVPLSEELIALLRSLPRIGEFVFSTDGKHPISGFSKIKTNLDKNIEDAQGEKAITAWRIHDLRRSMATGLADHLGIAPHVIEAALNHVSGEKKGVAGIYNRSRYEAECRRALEAWAKVVTAKSAPANVVPLRA